MSAVSHDGPPGIGQPGTLPGKFVVSELFVENAFQRRFQHLLWTCRIERAWRATAAILGSGKTRGIADFVAQSGGIKEANGRTTRPVLAALAPKNASPESALGHQLVAAFGTVPSMAWGRLKVWLVDELARAEVELLIIDDAHDIQTNHLALLKELTDQLYLTHGRKVGLCLVCASTTAGDVPLKAHFEQKGLFWEQIKRRLAADRPYPFVANHTADEVREICAGYQAIYRPQFADLDLVRWSAAFFTYLTHPLVDAHSTGRVTMNNFVKLLTLALATAHARNLTDLDAPSLHAAAEVLMLSAGKVAMVDGEPDMWSSESMAAE